MEGQWKGVEGRWKGVEGSSGLGAAPLCASEAATVGRGSGPEVWRGGRRDAGLRARVGQRAVG